MAISVTAAGKNNNSTGATVAVTGLSIPANVLIIATDVDNSNGTPAGSMTDSSSNTYTNATNLSTGGSTGNSFAGVWYFSNNSASLTSVTYTKRLSGNSASIGVTYATGIRTTSPLDSAVTKTATGTGTTPSSGASGVPTIANSLLYAFTGEQAGAAVTWTQDTGNGWPSSNFNNISASRTNSIDGTQVTSASKTYAPTYTGGSDAWAVTVIGFKPATANTGQDITIMVLDAHRVNFQG